MNQVKGLDQSGNPLPKMSSEIQGISTVEGVLDNEQKAEDLIYSQRKLFRVKKWKASDKNKKEFQKKEYR